MRIIFRGQYSILFKVRTSRDLGSQLPRTRSLDDPSAPLKLLTETEVIFATEIQSACTTGAVPPGFFLARRCSVELSETIETQLLPGFAPAGSNAPPSVVFPLESAFGRDLQGLTTRTSLRTILIAASPRYRLPGKSRISKGSPPSLSVRQKRCERTGGSENSQGVSYPRSV
jgi:hypothetical protein